MIWTIHTRTDAMGRDVRAVPEAAAKWALIFGTLWLLWHRLWWQALVFLLVMAILQVLAGMAMPDGLGAGAPWVVLAAGVLPLLPRFWLLLEGNQLRRTALERRGWRMADVVEASGREEAELIGGARWETAIDRARAARAAQARMAVPPNAVPVVNEPGPPMPTEALPPEAPALEALPLEAPALEAPPPEPTFAPPHTPAPPQPVIESIEPQGEPRP